jgi:6-phosphogluconolactonase
MNHSSNVTIFDTPVQLALAAAEKFVDCARDAAHARGLFSVALAGGNTPKRVYQLLATEQFKNRIEWASVHIFFGDERCVPPDHPDSNYRMAYEMFLSKVAIPPKNVHRIIGEAEPAEGATEYEQQLRVFFAGLSWPRFDFVFLGMGEDGHTASLFPGSSALREQSRWVLNTKAERLKQDRITLTAPVFNHSANVMFLITGKEKAERVAEVLGGPAKAEPLPAQLIRPLDGTLEWFLDRDAASRVN